MRTRLRTCSSKLMTLAARKPINAAMVLTLLAATIVFALDFVVATAAGEYFVPTLPGATSDLMLPKMYAGHIEIKPEHHGNLFFWMFENEHIADKPRTIIWLNGGPGCSSMDGAMMEVGPFRVGSDGKLVQNSGRWNQYANVLFVDNPLGTGFSFVDTDSYLHELPEMVNDFMTFMDTFFDLFPQYLVDDMYIAGESYAGMYIPYITDAILARNNGTTEGQHYPLKGIMIGNGWIDPVRQYLAYVPYSYQMGLLQDGTEGAAKVNTALDKCVAQLNQGGPVVDVPLCESVLDKILEVSQDMSQKGGKTCHNMYDVGKFDSFPACGSSWPQDLEYVTPYLRRPEVIEALHISPEKKSGWVECAGAVSRAFAAKNSRPSVELLPAILEQIPVLMFNGDQDLICNHLGNEDLISRLEFNGGKGFEEKAGGNWAPRETWTYEGVPTGMYQSARNLTYVLIYNASHMVPFDLPNQSRDMLHRFMNVDYNYAGVEPPKSQVGDVGHGNSTVPGVGDDNDEDEDGKKIKDATRAAYFRAGELALIIVALAATGFGIFVVYQRRQAAKGGYRTVGFAKRDQMIRLEDGGGRRNNIEEDDEDRDVNELDELVVESPVVTSDEIERRMMYDAGEIITDSEEEEDAGQTSELRPKRKSRESIRSDGSSTSGQA
ncbi:Alpha/Beta hydrolase protein [Lipomyces arxii]|uniref:Alpha/Beta hydrolase protein n=1 Tax=Lipomyces arxii TaxID=56418 RepID=UPI0034CEAE7B